MAKLKDQICNIIKAQGPITVSQFMALALSDNQHGYYKTKKPFGIEGDFITAPEVSQMFGELVGIWVLQMWQIMQMPQNFILCEMGPGRGTLMYDVLRTIKQLSPQCFINANIYMVETSPRLKEEQKQKLSIFDKNIIWGDRLEEIPKAPLILFANELLDALPIEQYMKYEDKWHQRLISLNCNGELIFALGSQCLDTKKISKYYQDLPNNAIMELAPLRNLLIETVAKHLLKTTGTALFIDYGSDIIAHGDTLQSMSKHHYSNIFDNPGADDLTSHVDFASLQKIAKKNMLDVKVLEQGEFLLRMGLLERAGQLGYNKDQKTQDKIRSEVEKLAADNEMGKLFKVMQLSDAKTKLHPIFL